jgi:hypothetical protein
MHKLILSATAVFALITGSLMVSVNAGAPGVFAGVFLVLAGLLTAYGVYTLAREEAQR